MKSIPPGKLIRVWVHTRPGAQRDIYSYDPGIGFDADGVALVLDKLVFGRLHGLVRMGMQSWDPPRFPGAKTMPHRQGKVDAMAAKFNHAKLVAHNPGAPLTDDAYGIIFSQVSQQLS